MRRKVGILLYDYVDVLDFAGPAEVLSLTSNTKAEQALNLYKKRLLPTNPFEVLTITESGEQIKTHSGIKVTPEYSMNNCPELDILIIPGGPLRAVQSIADNQSIIKWIQKHKDIEYLCSVCTGALILAEAKLLSGKKATTHHLAINMLQNKYPDIRILEDSKVVHDANIITSGGVSSGINMAIYLVQQTIGLTAANRIAKTIEFDKE